ncbi:lipopolysaccharide biosynthesis glycosyltransferase [Rhizobium sp. SG_E_25_P2]|uniref:glycosyltransferase n=1 Tax=Rhizobium sp. SG_E_25_P2 TaxID=2879942 RepID=UPI0024739DBD|nr:glycosyltransferase [Rhizobium sp. SG_E_25_P2]MDH6265090.1 lipopolysaccharide biosynthesis glycosyltransferase [Rhizobium sp. SG_E_25_P2]
MIGLTQKKKRKMVSQGGNVRRWVFSLDQRATGWFRDCLKAAVVSAKQHTTLEPICILDGDTESDFARWLKNAGVTVIKHEVSFKSELFSDAVIHANQGSPYNPAQASGAYLRVEAARILEDDVFLYTDCDIMFVADPAPDFYAPKVFGACAEIVSEGDHYVETQSFNSGVMVVNRANFVQKVEGFIEFCRARNFYSRQHSSYDQTHLNLYFGHEWEKMSPNLNWRPFQGIGEAASIIHFHGPKPQRIDKILSGEASAQEIDSMRHLINSNIDSYAYYVGRFNEFLKEADS